MKLAQRHAIRAARRPVHAVASLSLGCITATGLLAALAQDLYEAEAGSDQAAALLQEVGHQLRHVRAWDRELRKMVGEEARGVVRAAATKGAQT